MFSMFVIQTLLIQVHGLTLLYNVGVRLELFKKCQNYLKWCGLSLISDIIPASFYKPEGAPCFLRCTVSQCNWLVHVVNFFHLNAVPLCPSKISDK